MTTAVPTHQAVLDALSDGPLSTTALRTRLAASRTAVEAILTTLADQNHVIRLGPDHPIREHRGRWTLTNHDPHPAPDNPDTGTDHDNDPDTSPDTGPDDALLEELTSNTPADDGNGDHGDGDDGSIAPDPGTPDDGSDALPEPAHDDGTGSDQDAAPDALAADEEQPQPAADDVKLCRGCQNQIPKTCPTCWQKTPAYCGTCRKDTKPRPRTTSNGQPEILPSGLPKLAHGQLAVLVEQVMRTHPIPAHLGIIGWTATRIAIYLPGRSTGAISNALEKLTNTGTAERLNDNPKRYQLTSSPTNPRPDDDPTATDLAAEHIAQDPPQQ